MTQHRRTRACVGVLAVRHRAALILAGCSGLDRQQPSRVGPRISRSLRHLQQPREPRTRRWQNSTWRRTPDVKITTNPDAERQVRRDHPHPAPGRKRLRRRPDHARQRRRARVLIGLAEAGFLEPLGDTAKSLVPEGSESLFEIDGKVYGQPLELPSALSSRASATPAAWASRTSPGRRRWPTSTQRARLRQPPADPSSRLPVPPRRTRG